MVQKGASYQDVADYIYRTTEVKVSFSTIRNRYKKMCAENEGKEVKENLKSGRKKRDEIPDGEILTLKEQGLSSQQIVNYYMKKGIVVGKSTIKDRLRKIHVEAGGMSQSEDSLADLDKKLRKCMTIKKESSKLVQAYERLQSDKGVEK